MEPLPSRPPRPSGGGLPPALEKLERECLRLLQVLSEMRRDSIPQSLRQIAERAGMSKDEVHRYLNPRVSELYTYERLLGVRSRNRPLYNYLIVSGPPKVEGGKWAGILANTSKFPLFKAVAMRYGWDVRFIGQRGLLVDLVYRGIPEMAPERLGRTFPTEEATLLLDPLLEGGDRSRGTT